MQLEPCPACRRHVSTAERACPFCGASIGGAPRRPTLSGRWSRAAVFASATLVGCYVAPDPQRPPPPPPPDDRIPPPPPDDRAPPPDGREFAQPPPGLPLGVIEGRVTDAASGQPLVGIVVQAVATGGTIAQTTTDARGSYRFSGFAAGPYRVVFVAPGPNHPRQAPQPGVTRVIQLGANVTARIDVSLQQPPPVPIDRGPCCKPYGAPPARRRVV